jgi:uncharacterized protein
MLEAAALDRTILFFAYYIQLEGSAMRQFILMRSLALLCGTALMSFDGRVVGQDVPGRQDRFAEMVEKVAAALPTEAPVKPKQPRKLLVYSRTAGFRHSSIPIAIRSLTMIGEKTGAYTVDASDDPAVFEPENLNKYDGVFLVSTTGEFLNPAKNNTGPGFGRRGASDPPAPQGPEAADAAARHERYKKSLMDFVKSGKGLMGLHAAADSYAGSSWPEWAGLIGAGFQSHPWTKLVPVKNVDPKHPLNTAFENKGFEINDEIYQFRLDTADPKKLHVLLQLDVSQMTDATKGNRGAEGPYYVSWIQPYGKGRVFYCSLGHREEIQWNSAVLKHYLAGIQYALGDLDADSMPSSSQSQ